MEGSIERLLSHPMAVDLASLAGAASGRLYRRVGGEPSGPEAFCLLPNGVALIQVRGLITWGDGVVARYWGGADWEAITDSLMVALDSEDVETVLLECDSPGGDIRGVSGAVDAVRRLRGRGKRVVAAAHEWMLSAMYWLASACDEIVVTPSAMVGCLGVVLPYEDSSGRYERDGIKKRLITTSPVKGINIPGIAVTEPMVDAELAAVAQLDDLFMADVVSGRGVSEETYGAWRDSPKLVGQRAVDAGMADRVMQFENLLEELTGEVAQSSDDGGRNMATPRQMAARAGATPANPQSQGGQQAARAEDAPMTPDQLRNLYPDAVAQMEDGFKKKIEEEARAADEKAKEEEEKAKAAAAGQSASAAGQGAAAQAGDLGAIMREIGDSSDAAKAFAADAAVTRMTPAQAKAMWERQRKAAAGAEAAAAADSATPAAASGGGGAPEGQDYMGACKALAAEKGIPFHQAAAEINRTRPELRAAYVGRDHAAAAS